MAISHSSRCLSHPTPHLNLSAVQINGDDSIDAHRLEQTRDVGGRDWHARLHLAVLTRIPIVRNDGGNVACGGAAKRRDEQQQLHERVIDARRTRRLHNVAVLTAH